MSRIVLVIVLVGGLTAAHTASGAEFGDLLPLETTGVKAFLSLPAETFQCAG